MTFNIKLPFFIFTIFCFTSSWAQEGEVVYANSKITKVTVYVNGAQITREAEVSIGKGITNIVFEGVTLDLNKESIQLGGTGNVNLLSVVHRINYNNQMPVSPRVKEIKDSIEDIQFLLDQLANKKYVTEQEIELILANKATKGDKGFDLTAFEDLQEIYTKRLPALKDEALKNKMEERRLQTKLTQLNRQYSDFNQSYATGRPEIVASIKSDMAKKLKLELSYYTWAASWYPIYDVRCKDLNSSIQLIYKANVQQNCGEDWNQVMMKISLGNPILSGTKPELEVKKLGWEVPNWNYGDQIEMTVKKNRKLDYKSEESKPAAAAADSDGGGRYRNKEVTMSQNVLNVDFNIAIPYTIPSNGKYVTIDAQTFDLPATYQISVVPKLDRSAFLLAEVESKDEISQLNGMASVYFEGMYTGQSAVVSGSNDSMKISLGRDKSIFAERKKIREKSSKSFLGSKRTEESTFEITVKNNKSIPTTITVEDQVPVSTDKEIEVELKDIGAATLDEQTGLLKWKLTLAPGESKKIGFSFNVKYPKNRTVTPY